MTQPEFEKQVKRLRDHFGERHYSHDLVTMIWVDFQNAPNHSFRDVISEGIARFTQSRPPLRDDFRTLAREMRIITGSGTMWRHFEVDDCMRCGGGGWHFVHTPKGGEGVVACDHCKAGKNLQAGPRGIVTHTLAQCPTGTSYSRPGQIRAPTLHKAQGMPPAVEAVCDMISEARTENGAFKFALSYLKLTQDQAWEIYEQWCHGKVHPLAKRQAPNMVQTIVSQNV